VERQGWGVVSARRAVERALQFYQPQIHTDVHR
jgi:hypothetical protein